MVKYNPELKAQVVGQFLNDKMSVVELAQKYRVPKRQIQYWIQRYRLGGIETLERKANKRKFSTDFKLSVIDYYQTHDESLAAVATKYDILACQISVWRTGFNRDGVEALRSHQKGRPAKVKRKKKSTSSPEKQNEVERLRAELIQKNKELYETRLENDILKKSMALFGPSKDDAKHK